MNPLDQEATVAETFTLLPRLGVTFLLPVLLLHLFGYGVSLDVEHVPIALMEPLEEPRLDRT